MEQIKGVAIAFISEGEWPKAKAAMLDGHQMQDTYAAYLAKVAAVQLQLTLQGTASIRVPIVVADFVQWCATTGRQADAQARQQFAALVAAQQDGGGQAQEPHA